MNLTRSLGPVVWRQPISLYGPLGWLAAVAWPPIVGTLIVFAPTEAAGGLVNDWRLKALIAGGLAIAAILWIIKGEREREGAPATRLGVMSRFLLFGFIFSLAALILVVLGFSIVSAFGDEGFLPALGGIESTLFLFGVAGLPFALMVGVSYALWAGFMVAVVCFTPPRPRTSVMFDLGAEAPSAAESPSVRSRETRAEGVLQPEMEDPPAP